ncbi:MAG: Hsp70 family protein, partial [Myxococcales bacterium]|nr:Hsp70 family protein [Myxococcales bacterium]
VSAKDLRTGKSQQIRVTASGGLSEGEIEGLIDDAEANAEEDRQRRGLVELKNRADGLVYSTERTLEEYAEHIAEEDQQALSTAIEKTRAADEGGDAQGLAAAVDELSALSYQMTENLYAKLGGDSAEE